RWALDPSIENDRILRIEGWPSTRGKSPFVALHNGRYVYIRTKNDIDEMYDLSSDPFQLANLLSPNPSTSTLRIKKSLLDEDD
ncbi:MAG: hypothetical protein KDD53_06930, partial [Bdellovibrionales bacterium]|nr:hypothetical protein [Bdellovibrionales bacterium]